ncbi:sensor histidine kinase [Paracoccus aerius]
MLKTKDLAILSLIAVIICAVFLLDLYVPLGTAVWLIYIVPLAISFSASLPWIPLAVAIASCIAMLAGFYFDSHLAGIDPRIAAVNRTMASIVYLVLGNMGRLLIRNREALDRDAWIRQGEVEVSQAVQGDPGAAQLGERVLSTLAGRIGARAAVAYGSDAPGVSRLAAWGVDEASLGAGAGLRAGTLPAPWPRTGPCIWNWPPTRHWAGVGPVAGPCRPCAYRSGGRGGQIDGLLEFGFDGPPPPRATELLDRVGERIGLALRSVKYRQRLQELLEETRHQAEELRSHAEELAATNEELEEQSRALQESQRRLEEQQAELEQQNSQLESQTQELEDQRDALAKSRRQLEAKTVELARESRYKSEFVANMSHELRTPLNALLIMARLLAENRGRNLSDEQVRWAETIESSGKDLLVLINDILDLSKIEAGKMDLAAEAVDPQTVARKLVRAFEEQARAKGLELGFELAPALKPIQTDPARLEQVLRNFLSNALKFTERGRVTLRIGPAAGGGTAFSVSDTGIGIDTDQQEAVFEAFRQADGTISRRFGERGLGSRSRANWPICWGPDHPGKRQGQGQHLQPDPARRAGQGRGGRPAGG